MSCHNHVAAVALYVAHYNLCRTHEALRTTPAKAFLRSYPKAAYLSEVEQWREMPDGAIEFTMRRLPTAD
jgi:hypothetical protein